MKKLSGREAAPFFTQQIKSQAMALKEKTGVTPRLSVILIGKNPASLIYVQNKMKACKKAGIDSECLEFPETISKEKIKNTIEELAKNKNIHALLVQWPLPPHLNGQEILSWLPPEKDVDALSAFHTGRLWSGTGEFSPCTAWGILKLLEYYKIPIEGRDCVVIGRSQIVGLPAAALLLKKSATLTICHSKTKSLKEHTKRADIVIAACGKHHFLKAQDFKKGAVAIDVGIHHIEKGRIEGDINPEGAEKILSALSPVPGGVGPMTITGLLQNTYQLACRQILSPISSPIPK